VGEWLPEPLATDAASDPSGVLRADESISMAFLVMLERLTPVERAVFLLREIFEYRYADIATALGLEAANCRRFLRRAQQHVPRGCARGSPPLRANTTSCSNGSRGDAERRYGWALLALLARTSSCIPTAAAREPRCPIRCAARTGSPAAFVGGLEKLVPRNRVQRIVQINGHSAVVSYLDGKPHSVLTLEVSNGRIQAIYIVTNPEKLSHLPPVS